MPNKIIQIFLTRYILVHTFRHFIFFGIGEVNFLTIIFVFSYINFFLNIYQRFKYKPTSSWKFFLIS